MTDSAAERPSVAVQFMRVGTHDLIIPCQQSAMAAGLDLPACLDESVELAPGARVLVSTGFAIALPAGFEGQVRPRSGLALKHGITVLNSPGTIDADYRGEVKVLLINHGQRPFTIERGDRIAQLVVAPVCAVATHEVDQLDATDRGTSGYGSTGQQSVPSA